MQQIKPIPILSFYEKLHLTLKKSTVLNIVKVNVQNHSTSNMA